SLDDRRWTKVSPGKLLLACPPQANRLACRPRQPRRLDGCLPRMFPAERRPEIRHNHSRRALAKMKRAYKFGPMAKRILRARPDGHFIIVPLGHGGSRLQW